MNYKKSIWLVVLCGSTIFVANTSAQETKIYLESRLGIIQYHQPSAVINKNGRIIPTDSLGNKQYHKQQYQIKDGKIFKTDSRGNIQYHKPHAVIQE